MGKGPETNPLVNATVANAKSGTELYGRTPPSTPVNVGVLGSPSSSPVAHAPSTSQNSMTTDELFFNVATGKGPTSSGKGPAAQPAPVFEDYPGFSSGGSFWSDFGGAVDSQRAKREYEEAEAKRKAEEERLAMLRAQQMRNNHDGGQHGDRDHGPNSF